MIILQDYGEKVDFQILLRLLRTVGVYTEFIAKELSIKHTTLQNYITPPDYIGREPKILVPPFDVAMGIIRIALSSRLSDKYLHVCGIPYRYAVPIDMLNIPATSGSFTDCTSRHSEVA